jgi:hypothetical protein
MLHSQGVKINIRILGKSPTSFGSGYSGPSLSLCQAYRPTRVALLAIYRQLHNSDRPWGYKYPGRPRALRLTKQHDLHLTLNDLRQ